MAIDISRRSFLRNAMAALPAGMLGAGAEFAHAQTSSVEVNARRIESFDPRDASHIRYGSLEFRSGLVLTSSFRGFGGLSGLRLDKKGEQFIALSDKGNWFTGRIAYRGKVMTGLADVKSAPMLDSDGKKITARGWFDSESLALDGSTVYVGLERVNQILRFDFSKGGIRSRGEIVPVPPEIGKLPFNKGLETLVFVPKGQPLAGTLIAISERGLDASGNIQGFLLGGPSPGQFSVRLTKNFDISDATLLPSGDLLLLERKFSMLEGVGIRIRRVPLASVVPGAVIDGPTIFEVDLGYEIDNMEGIDTHVTADGDTVVTMVSDDNFSMIQRTLLLQFTLVEE
ncbi:MAG TPA: twin-arginine translocation pathway signal [Afipia sp.]|nr:MULTISPECIES: esterase-like activity of phytase family protein [unclassified Afipia]MAH70973.1 twin-arginine translocation pathway signal [Afipia sp.]OUX59829.1 MAG: twin-arginine translocation pathway signal [Afipia sp. TMED4]HAP13025.1 twin-arginine translocation pathway signal [Afipia sp.]HAP48759.1 twin-arginine translocation pathway signal [Afipia sp.]HBF54552.1 twin-arginine translocation pathway signal [Afipia sp.]